MLRDLSTISAINPALMAGKMRDPFGRFVATAAFVWPSVEVIAIAPVVRPLGGAGIRHIYNMQGFAGIIRRNLGDSFVKARFLHIAYQSDAPSPFSTHFWMTDEAVLLSHASLDEVRRWVPDEILKNYKPNGPTLNYLRDLNGIGEELLAEIIRSLTGKG